MVRGMRLMSSLSPKGLPTAALCAALLLPTVVHAGLTGVTSEQVLAEVHARVMHDLTTLSQDDVTADADDGPILSMPSPEQLLIGRLTDVWMKPSYWENYVREVLFNMNVVLPLPTDAVRPEIWTANVHVANGDYVSPMPMALQDISQLTYEWEGAVKTVEDYMLTTETDTIVFLANGALVDELYYNGYTENTRNQPWSVTKTFIAVTVGIAYDEGHIDSLQDPIEKYIPELEGTAWEGATLENILQMESGVHWDEANIVVLAENTQVQQWTQIALHHHSQGQLGMTRNEFLKSLPKAYEQGTQWSYNSGNTQVLAWMLELIYDKPYNEIISEKLWQPMGAQGDAKMIADREGGVIASQGLYARARDFARFGELMRNGGVAANGHRIVSAEWLDAMIQMTDLSNGAYGYQTWNSGAGEGAYLAGGFQGQKITVVPNKCVTAVRLSHTLAAHFRDGDIQDPSAYGFFTHDGGVEWGSMVRQLSEQIGGCDDTGAMAGSRRGKTSRGGATGLPLLAIVVVALAWSRSRRAS